MQRKPGGYRMPTDQQRRESIIDKKDFDLWFQQSWNITGVVREDQKLYEVNPARKKLE